LLLLLQLKRTLWKQELKRQETDRELFGTKPADSRLKSSGIRRRRCMEEIITTSEVAALLKVHVKTIYNLAARGKIPGSRIGRIWRFNRSEVLELLSNRSLDGLGGELQ
jgi:excisionase family DNA binding protein